MRGRDNTLAFPPKKIAESREDARKLANTEFVGILNASLRTVSSKAVLPPTLRQMVNDCVNARARPASLETSVACFMVLLPRLSAEHVLAFVEEMAFQVNSRATGPVFGDEMELADAESDAESEGNKLVTRALSKNATPEVRMLAARALHMHAQKATRLGNRLMLHVTHPSLTLSSARA